MERPTERQVADWLLALAPLVAATMPANEARERVKAYVPELVARFDSRDFDASSREFVARNCRFFPSYGELCELLDKWPRPAEKPQHTGPEAADLTAMDRSWIEFWHRRRAELFAKQDGFKWGSREADLENLASLIRAQSRKAWAVISGVPEVEQAPPSERELAYVASVVRPMAKAISTHEERPRPAYLRPEVLAQARKTAGLSVPGDEIWDHVG